jgi:hypothetical protein
MLVGVALDGKIPLPLMTKGERFIICKGKFLEREHRCMFPREATLDGKIPFPLMTKGELFIRCKGKFLEREHRGMFPRGAIFTRE